MTEEKYDVERVVSFRRLHIRPDGFFKVKLTVKWQGYPESDNTEEPLEQ